MGDTIGAASIGGVERSNLSMLADAAAFVRDWQSRFDRQMREQVETELLPAARGNGAGIYVENATVDKLEFISFTFQTRLLRRSIPY